MKMEKSSVLNEVLVGHLRAKDTYLANAKVMIDKGETEKASELLWGACLQMVFALSSLKGITLPDHGTTKRYVLELSKEIKDEEIWKLFSLLEKLHANFYHGFLTKEEFPQYVEAAKIFITKLEKVLKEKVS